MFASSDSVPSTFCFVLSTVEGTSTGLTILLILAWEMLSILSNPVMLTLRCFHLFKPRLSNIIHKGATEKKLLQVPFADPCFIIWGRFAIEFHFCQALIIFAFPKVLLQLIFPCSLKTRLHD